MTTYHNLKEFLETEGYDTPYSFGRALYKYTDCGPWTSFTVLVRPERTEQYRIAIRKQAGKLVASGKKLNPDILSFLGFREDGPPIAGDLDEYYKLIKKFLKKEPRGTRYYEFVSRHKGKGCIRLVLTRSFPAETRDIYYEDKEASQTDWLDQCTGIVIGSIVEGSDVEITPESLSFPFTEDDLDKVVKGINDEAGFYWQRDNSMWLDVYKNGEHLAYVKETWGEITWEAESEDIPADVKTAVEAMIQDEDPVFKEFNFPYPVPGFPGWVVEERLNDDIY